METISINISSGPGNIRFQTPSAILAFAPLKTAALGNNDNVSIDFCENIYKSSSSATSGSTTFSAGGYSLLPFTDTRLYYLGASLLSSSFGSAYGWGSSASSSYSGSFHNPLFWMYASASTFSLNHTNLYYTTFQSESTIQGFSGPGVLSKYLNLVGTSNHNPILTNPAYFSFTLPPITSPAYNYQLIVSRSVQLYNTTGKSGWRTIKDWTSTISDNSQQDGEIPDPTQYKKDSLRSGSSSTDKTMNGINVQANFNTSSGFYFFVRNNLPGQDTTYIRSIPLEYTFSAKIEQSLPDAYMMSFGITSASLQSNGIIVSQSIPLTFSSREITPGTGYIPITFSGSFDLFQPTPSANQGLSVTNTSSVAANSREGIIFQLSSSNGISIRIQSASLDIKQPLTGRQVAFPIPIDTVTTTPTQNDTGSYLVITPYLNFGAGSLSGKSGGADFDRDIFEESNPNPFAPRNRTTRFNFKFAVYYFKTAYALWRDGWRVTARRENNQSNTTSTQLNWLNASSCPSWAATSGSAGLTFNNIYVRNPGWLYASRSANNAFIAYGTSSSDPAVRNRSYVGIAAELLGGSELIPHLKGNFSTSPNEVYSASFLGAQFGGAIVIKRSRVGFSSSVLYERSIPSTVSNGHIYYYPGVASMSAGYNILNPADGTISAVGLPFTMVNDCDVVPLSLWYYDHNKPSSLFWPTNINIQSTIWPRTEVGNYYAASDAEYGYDGYTF
jgi:hypothetical protein